jgi:polyhydroxybutyrate depolymerase
MRVLLRLLILTLIATYSLALAPLAKADDSPTDLPSPPQPGRFALTVKSGGFDRVARIHVPTGYRAGTKPPLVLMLHGAGGDGTGALDKDGWAAKADKEGFIVVAPDGLPARPGSPANFVTNPRLWNSGQLRARAPRAAIDDVAFVRQLLDTLQEKIPFDERRTFCAGHSNGGGMTFRLATELSERFVAIGTAAGLMVVEDPKPKRPLPTLYILGTKDPLRPIDGGEVKLPWGSRHIPPVAEPLAAWAQAIGCVTQPKLVSNKDNVKRFEYPSRSNGPALEVMYLEGHGHHWPGGRRVLPESMVGPITSKLDATAVLWEFFQANSPR